MTALADPAPLHSEDDSLDAVDYLLPAGMVLFSSAVFWGFARTVLDAEYSRIGTSSIQRNFTVGFEWDADGFPINQIGHPYQGSLYHTAARATGHDFWVAALYTFLGSLQWEMFMENELPSYNDLITTTFSGAAFGETLFRLGSELLDPSTSGSERVWRELGAGVIAPTMGLTRTLTGGIVESGDREESNILWAAIFLWAFEAGLPTREILTRAG
ncbi:MAG: DUF3943 domain-containing protein [Bradymonadaceae bacterium]|nr:DUF3943 domain-containing protein [Lujinxingiaceae bacterium]